MRYPCLMLNIILFYFLHRNRINTNFTLKEFLSWYPTLMVFRFWDCPKGLTSASVGRWWRLGREGNLNLGKIYLKLNPRELVGWMWPEENTPSCCSTNTSVILWRRLVKSVNVELYRLYYTKEEYCGISSMKIGSEYVGWSVSVPSCWNMLFT